MIRLLQSCCMELVHDKSASSFTNMINIIFTIIIVLISAQQRRFILYLCETHSDEPTSFFSSRFLTVLISSLLLSLFLQKPPGSFPPRTGKDGHLLWQIGESELNKDGLFARNVCTQDSFHQAWRILVLSSWMCVGAAINHETGIWLLLC